MKIKSSKVIGFTSVLVSVSTLVILLYQLNLTRKQQYASALPYIHFENSGMYTDAFKLRIRNAGTGPGFITDINIISGKDIYPEDPYAFIKRLHLSYEDSLSFTHSNIYAGQVIASGEYLDVLTALNRSSGDSLVKLFNDPKVIIQINYKSVYEEEWIITNKTTIPTKTN